MFKFKRPANLVMSVNFANKVYHGSLTDIIEMDAASNNSVEDVRQIRDAVNFLPTKAKYKVYIIDEVHMLSTGAFNALLKTLEEPPEHVKFILATTEPQKLPTTILSRCQRFDFKRLSNEDIIKDLEFVCRESNIKIKPDALNLIAVLAEGGMRDALSILERCAQDEEEFIDAVKVKNLIGIPQTIHIYNIVNNIIEKNSVEALQTLQQLIDDGKDINYLLWEIIKYVKDVLLFKSTNKLELYSDDEIKNIQELSQKASKQFFIDLICSLSEAEDTIKKSTQKWIILQAELIKLCNTENATPASVSQNVNSNLESRVKKIENFLQAGNFEKLISSAKKATDKTTKQPEELAKTKPKPKYVGPPQDYWPKLIEDFKQSGKMLMYMNLAGTTAYEVNDMQLEINFPNGINKLTKEFLSRPDTKQDLRESVHLACGKEMQIKFVDNNVSPQDEQNEFEKFMGNNDLPFNII